MVFCFGLPTEQLAVHEACQKEKADGGRRKQSSALEQRGGTFVVYLHLFCDSCVMLIWSPCSFYVSVFFIRQFVAMVHRMLYLFAQSKKENFSLLRIGKLT